MKTIRQFLNQPYLYIFIILIGISFKFYNVDHKFFWIDEIFTIQHTSGILDRDYPALIPINEVKNICFYNDLYHLNKQQYTIASELKGLLSSTQLNPLHYPFLMVWYRVVGDNPIDFRFFSVFIFILTLPFLFLLSKNLFNSKLAGWMAVSLYAISPFIHLFAQEARYYILWSFILIVLHYLFLQGIQRNNQKWWSAYTFIVALSLYASPVSAIIIFGHLIFVWLTRKDLIKASVFSIVIGFILYLPWALWLYFNLNRIISALSWHSSYNPEVAFWFPLMGQCFYLFSIFSSTLDFFYVFDRPSTNMPPDAGSAFILNFAVLILIVMAFVFLLRKTEKETKYFLLLIVLPGLIFFYFLDLVRNGMTSWWWRYLIFIATGIILVMTNFLYKKIEKGSLYYSFIFLALAAIGISSMQNISKTKTWFLGKKWDVYIEDARLFSNAQKPLLITDYSYTNGMVDFMAVMLECHSENIDILRASPDIENVENMINHKDYSDIYVFHASKKLIGNLKSQFGEKMDSLNVGGTSSIWKINMNYQN
jgi:uncharacterized membrane protein